MDGILLNNEIIRTLNMKPLDQILQPDHPEDDRSGQNSPEPENGLNPEENIFKQLLRYYQNKELYSYNFDGEKVKITGDRKNPLKQWLELTAKDIKNNFFQRGKPYPRLTTRLLRSGLLLAVLNYAAYPPLESARLTFRSGMIGQLYRDLTTFKGMRDQVRAGYSARDFLEASSQIVFNGLDETDEKACELYPIIVQDMYRRLVNSSGRDYLLEYSRVVAGPPIFKERYGHMWLQLRENGQWVDFEASLNVSRLTEQYWDPEPIQDLSQRVKSLRGESVNEFDEVHFTSDDGKIFLPASSSWLYGGGFFGYALAAMAKK